jgi:alanine dehydrogenase
MVQAGAGEGSAIGDAAYEAQGATIVPAAETVFGEAELIVKVKEPQPAEVALQCPGHAIFTYLHLAPGSRTDGGPRRLGRDMHRL